MSSSKEDLANDVVIDNSIEQVIERDGTLDNVDIVNPSDVESDSVPVDLSGLTVRDIAEPFPYPDIKTVDKSTDTVKKYQICKIELNSTSHIFLSYLKYDILF